MAKILIIEDDPAQMQLTAMMLIHDGHTVLRAVDAESGMALARAELPDLIMMDVKLPGMDGLSATARLKQTRATASIPIIALTGLAKRHDEKNALAAGCDAYIAKPLRYQELYATIDTLLAKGKSRVP